MTPEMVENFCNDYCIPDEVHLVAPGRDKTITHFSEGKVGIYTSAARVSHFEVLTRVLDLSPSVTVFGGVLEKDPAPHLTAHQEQTVKLMESNKAPFRRYPECFLCLVGGSSSVAAPEVSAPAEVKPENVVPEDTYLDLTEPDADLAATRPEEVAMTQPGKYKRKRLVKQSDTLPAKQLKKDHPSLATGTGGKTLVGLRELMSTSPFVLRPSFQADIQGHVSVQSTRTADIPVYTAAATVTSARENVGVTPTLDIAGSSQLETLEGSDDSFYELPALNAVKAKCWYVPRWKITNDLLLDDSFSCCTLICLESKVRSHAEHELELKEKLKGRYDACGRLLEEKDLEILRLKSLLAKEAERAERVERAETAEVVRFRNQVSVLAAKVSALKITITQKDTDISLLDSRPTYLKSALDDSQAACAKSGSLITSLTSEMDRLSSKDFKEKEKAQQEEQAQGELYPAYLTTLAGRRWFLMHGIQLAVLKCFKSPEYQGILGHALGRVVDFGMQEVLEAGYEHRVARTQLSTIEAYNPEAAKTSYMDTVKALEDVDSPLVNFLKSKKDAKMDEVLDCFILDGLLADLPEAAYLQPCLEQLSVPIHHSDDKAIVGEIVFNPLSSRTWVGEMSTFAAPFSVKDFDEEDTDEALRSVVAIPKFEACRF
ncbi:hypothetical protein Tco_1032032 [Tanacetum coccineum]|uniref:Transposase (Putative), gypsy type n=1 Tax=Tanacetum coccineum TaxID=301880 RepID=A0ABQ5GC29_9ASTR